MLQILIGRSGSGKTEYIRRQIADAVKAGNEKIMVIIPEQNSFETETAILDLLGAKDSCKVKILSFTRLVELVLRTYGGIAGKYLNAGGRNIMMSLALDMAADNLNLYKSQTQKTELIPLMLSAVDEFKMCSVTSDRLREKAASADDDTLSGKLNEAALIMDCYDALVSKSYIDPMDDLTRLKAALENHQFFNGYTVYIDAFNGFTMQEMNVIEEILKQCDACYVALSGDNLNINDENNLFFTINRTKKDLTRLAKRNGIAVKAPLLFDSQYRFSKAGISALERSIYRTDIEKLYDKPSGVELFMADDIYIEANYVARTIKRLTVEADYKYSDFAIVCRQTESYKGIIDTALEKYGIPYFMDKPQEIDSKPLFALTLAIFDIVFSGFDSDYIFKYLKTGLTGLTTDDIAMLENYIFTWNISGKKWFNDFTANPDGFKEVITEKNKKELEYINTLRKKVITPIEHFAQAIATDSSLEISKAVFTLLTEIDCAKHLYKIAARLERNGNKDSAEDQLRIWESLMSILDQMATLPGDIPIEPKRYARLLRTVITLSDIAYIPRTLDEVTVGTADRVRLSSPRAVFIIGAIEGEFPHTPVAAGIFSDAERRRLLSLELPMYDSVAQLAVQEKYHVYCAVAAPRERLFVSWYNADIQGGIKKPSSIIREAVKILPRLNIQTEENLSVSDKIWAEKVAFEMLAAKSELTDTEYRQLKRYFSEHSDYSKKVKALERVRCKTPSSIENKELARELFSTDPKLSASQIEKFYLCRFQYFCRYGLKAHERKPAEIDALQYGSLMHFLLENILKYFGGKKLDDISDKELTVKINALLDEYVNKNMGGLDDKSERFKYLYYRLCSSAHSLIKHILRELSQSEFEPVDFELSIANGGDIEAYRLLLPNGHEVTVEGKVDRVDIMKKGDINYIRVIDYKTGPKLFKLSDILYGLNMQMLLYLSAISTNGEQRYNGNIVPAGVLYMPAASPTVNATERNNEKNINAERDKKYAMNGLILDNNLVIQGMENEAKGIFIPVSLKDGQPSKGVNSLVTLEQMGKIFKRIDTLITEMAVALSNGEIANIPAKGEYDACTWCPYKTVCGFEDGDPFREILRLDKKEIIKNLEEDNHIEKEKE